MAPRRSLLAYEPARRYERADGRALPALAAEPTIALVQINQQALFFTQMNEGAEKKAKELGAKLVIFNANNDPAAQNNAIETYIADKVNGMVVVAIDTNGIVPAVQAAAAAGIPVAAVDAILPPGPQIAQVGVNNEAAGRAIGEHFLKVSGGKAKLGVVGALNSTIQNVRQKGFEDVVKAAPGVTMAGVVDGRNIQDNAMSAAESLMTANPDLTAIYATGEPALLGAVAAVESQGRQADVKIVGWDLTASAIKGIDAGYVVGVVQQDPAGMGAAAVEAAFKAITSKPAVDRDHRGADHHRHQGECRALPGRVQVMQQSDGAAPAAPVPRIRLTGIRKRFGSIEALRGVDLELFPGEVLGLVGDNAAGKSTLTKIIAGAYVPDAGTIELDGSPVTFATPAEARARRSRWSTRTSRSATRSTSPATCSSAASPGVRFWACACSTNGG